VIAYYPQPIGIVNPQRPQNIDEGAHSLYGAVGYPEDGACLLACQEVIHEDLSWVEHQLDCEEQQQHQAENGGALF
jgi:hypothetical protein